MHNYSNGVVAALACFDHSYAWKLNGGGGSLNGITFVSLYKMLFCDGHHKIKKLSELVDLTKIKSDT